MLYVGTETNAYISYDDGGTWHSMKGNLPVVPVYDLNVKNGDLIAATHGRSFWILDDLEHLRQVSGDFAGEDAHLLTPPTKIRMAAPFRGRGGSRAKNYQLALGAVVTFIDHKDDLGRISRQLLDAGNNPPAGVRVWYWLSEAPEDEVTLTFLDADGEEIRTYTSAEKKSDDDDDDGPDLPRVSAEAGMNCFEWSMRYQGR